MQRLHELAHGPIRLVLTVVLAGLAASPTSTLNAAIATQGGKLDLTGGTAWINTAGPIRGEDLKGKIVLLDFWTFCCINCHHVLPDLAFLEEKYKDELVVIGVHTPKFPAERDTENLRRKVAEYRIKHPVINDADQAIWSRYGVESWPTLGLFYVDGSIVGGFPGEGHRAQLDEIIGKLVARAKAAKTLDSRPFVVQPESEKKHDGALKFPGKLLADAPGNRLFLSDTGHNRIVVTDLEGKAVATIGSGQEGMTDGEYDKASFNRQQGLCLVGDYLYVADTENHAVRVVNLKTRKVSTVAGTGQQSYKKPAKAPAKTTGLTSPWDLALLPDGKTLAIAMAGNHQIWKLDLEGDTVGVMAGTSREDIIDGPAATAAFAQSSGLATDGKHLYVADSEGSCVRSIDLKKLNVKTLVGGHDFPGVLFNFGDADGQGDEVKLQHCLGVAYGDGKVFVADSYNNKIKEVDPETRTAKTLAGDRERGDGDSPARFNQPAGLSYADGTLYVADTNNHLIRAIDTKTGKTRTIELTGVAAPAAPKSPPRFPRAKAIDVAAATLKPGQEIAVNVSLTLPKGYKFNAGAPLVYLVESPGTPEILGADVSPTGDKLDPPAETFTIKVPLAKALSAGETMKLKVSLSMFICKEGSEGLCTLSNFIWTVPVTFQDAGAAAIEVRNK